MGEMGLISHKVSDSTFPKGNGKNRLEEVSTFRLALDGASMVRCFSCGASREEAFSRRMLGRRSGARCKACVAAAEAAEARAAAASQPSALAADAQPLRCAACERMLLPDAFSRSQLQQKGDARRCHGCISALAAQPIAGATSALLLSSAGGGSSVGGAGGVGSVSGGSGGVGGCSCIGGGHRHAKPLRSEPSPSVELQRVSKLKKLRRHFRELCLKHECTSPPILAFDRWLARGLLERPEASPGYPDAEPLLPVHGETAGRFVKDLVRDLARASIPAASADRIARDLRKVSDRYAAELKTAHEMAPAPTPEDVHLEWRGGSAQLRMRVWPPSRCCAVNQEHLHKLSIMYARSAAGGGSDGSLVGPTARTPIRTAIAPAAPPAAPPAVAPAVGSTVGSNTSIFHRRVLCLLLRYEALGGHGYQAAVSEAAFEVLRRRLGVSCECFASPLNATLPDYFSAFPDVDSFFGSRGSFFGANPIEGSFEVNPPYVPEVLLAAVHHAKRLLATAEAAARALSFVFVVPTWTPCAFHKELTSR